MPDREEKARLAERYLRIERDNEQIRQKVAAATNSLARTFDRIVVLLTERGFIDAGATRTATRRSPTTVVCWRGSTARATYWSPSRCAAASGRAWTPPELAAVLSAVLYETRGDTPTAPGGVDIPTGKLRRALNQTRRLWTELRADEQRHRISSSREPDDGFVPAIYRWAATGDLTTALAASDAAGTGSPLSAGDFVRWCRQVLDLLDQVRNAAPDPGAAGHRETRDQRRSARRRSC